MAKVSAPLLSFGASGQIGKTQVMSTWRGVKYARRYVVPANPNSESQQATRGVFKWIGQVWKLMNPNAQAVWTAFAKGKPLTDRNAIIKANLSVLRGTDIDPATTIDGLIGSPGVNAGLAPGALTLTDATGHVIGAALVAPALPAGWAITKQHALALKEQNANTDAFYTSYYASDAVTPYAAQISTGAAGDYVVVTWFEYTKPDGSVAYSPSVSGTVTIA